MVETALMFPILLLLFTGMIEVVFICHSYLVILDGSYQGAHLGSQGLTSYDNNEIFTLVKQDLPPAISNNLIDVIITRAERNPGKTTFKSFNVSHMISPGRDSNFTQAILSSRLDASDPSNRMIVVEVVYDQPLLFNMPIIRDIFPNPFPLAAYTIQYVARP
jgi:Flp pilus assembly protein TadG